jgi:hypothetical protein
VTNAGIVAREGDFSGADGPRWLIGVDVGACEGESAARLEGVSARGQPSLLRGRSSVFPRRSQVVAKATQAAPMATSPRRTAPAAVVRPTYSYLIEKESNRMTEWAGTR